MKRDRVYVLLTRLARAMRVDVASVYGWERNGFLDVYLVGGQRMIKREEANHLIRDWRRSCTPTAAAELIGIPQGTITGYIQGGIVKSIKMFRYRRVLRDSIEKAKRYAAGTRQRVHLKAVKLGKSGGGHRWTSKEVKKLWREGKFNNRHNGMKVYVPKTVTEKRAVGSKKLVTCTEAGRCYGKSAEHMMSLFMSGLVRGEVIGEQTLLYVHSVVSYTSRKAS